jgi:hypothetical protein
LFKTWLHDDNTPVCASAVMLLLLLLHLAAPQQ